MKKRKKRKRKKRNTECECCGKTVGELTPYKGREVWPEGFYDVYKEDNDGDISKLPLKYVCRFCLYGGYERYEEITKSTDLFSELDDVRCNYRFRVLNIKIEGV